MTSQGITLTAPQSTDGPRALPGARFALALLLTINLFNYIDRQVLSAVVPKIKHEFFLKKTVDEASAGPESTSVQSTEVKVVEDPWVKTKIGFLTTAFIVSYMLFSPVFGVLADRTSRWWLIGIGVFVWTIASGGSGLATGFGMLLMTRIFVGVGEAAYGPAAPAILSDMYPVSRRGTIMAWFYAAIPVGSALGFVLGGQMLNVSRWLTEHENWRWGFYAVVPPGLLLAAICFFMRETPRGQSDSVDASHHASREDYKIILRTPSFVYATLGYTALTFVLGGVGAWMPTYVSDSRGYANEAQASTIFGGIVVVGGLASTLLGGWAGDRLRKTFPGAYLLVSGWAVLLSFPLMICVVFVEFPYAWVFVFLSVFWMFFNTGPINTVLANVTHPSVRASGFALNILVIHLFGDAISPPLIGALADFGKKLAADGRVSGWVAEALSRHDGMDFSLICTSLLLLAAGLLWLWGARFLATDTALAPHRIASQPRAEVAATGVQTAS